ncbi:MAG: glycoside hydrolase family 88 protein [Bryobacteraceae bacterium]
MLALLALAVAAGPAVESTAGLTPKRTAIACLYGRDSANYDVAKHRVLLIGGLDGSAASASRVRSAMEWFETSPAAAAHRKRFAIAAIPLANPDSEKLQFPPQGEAYAKQTTSHYLWRWIGSHAPDQIAALGADPDGLLPALAANDAAGVGTIPGKIVPAEGDWLKAYLDTWKSGMPASPARAEMRIRMARTPKQVAEHMAVPYGHELPEVVYIPAVAVMGRLRLGALDDVERIVEPYYSRQKDSLAKATASHQSGHLLFADLAVRTKKPRYIELVRAAADMAFTADGQMREAMPLHNEMSDSLFMGGPILAAAGKLTGEAKYFDMAVRHLEFMRKLCWRADGLYRHSPLDEAAWGRGNGFPALGVALTLADLPKNHPGREALVEAFRKHIDALAKSQDHTGMWRQVIDVPGTYAELSSTCMIGVAMLRGVRNGWLKADDYRPRIDRAWEAVKARVASDGRLIDVCTSTGKQKSLQDYLDRTAILGKDPRGGAMVLLFSTEMAGLR